MSKENSSAKHVSQEINRVLASTPDSNSVFDNENLKETIKNIIEADKKFEQESGVFFTTGSNAFETAQKFTEIHVEQYRNGGRPSLPALAIHHAEKMGFDTESPEYKAMILVSVRAEMQIVASPEYHSKHHYMDVAAMTANLLEKNDEMSGGLSKKDMALAFTAAIGHDLEHNGKGNPKGSPFFNEEKSYSLMEPLLREAGLEDKDMAKINMILLTTSPDGPHKFLKDVAKAQRERKDIDFSKIDPDNKFPELKALANDNSLTQMAAVVSDSDLYASAGVDIKVNKLMSNLLSKETGMDLNSDGARKYFLDNIVGRDGFASNAGRAVANEALENMRSETNKRLSNISKPKAL